MMLTSVPRIPWKAGPAYICAACRCNIGIASISTSAPLNNAPRRDLGTKTLKVRFHRSPPALASHGELDSLRSMLLEEETKDNMGIEKKKEAKEVKRKRVGGKVEERVKEEKVKGRAKGRAEKKVPENKSTKKKNEKGADNEGAANQSTSTKTPNITTRSTTKNLGQGMKNKVGKDELNKDQLRKDQNLSMAVTTASLTQDDNSNAPGKVLLKKSKARQKGTETQITFPGAKGGSFKIRYSPGLSPDSSMEIKTSEMILQKITDTTSREDLVTIIESGNLSPEDTVTAVRKLRASLIKESSPKKKLELPKPTSSTSSFKQTLQKIGLEQSVEFRTIKDGMLSGNIVVKEPREPKSAREIKTGPIKITKAQALMGFEIETLSADDLELVPVEKSQERVPSLSYGLDRVLFNPGVYQLQDPRSRVFNFDPYLQKIMGVKDFDYNALKQYITSSKDVTLLDMAKSLHQKYTGSTSSMSSALCHFHFLLSQWRPVNPGLLSRDFPVQWNTFTSAQRGPSSVFLRWKDGTYAIDADKQYDWPTILSMLGESMEKLLTVPKEHFEKYRRENSDQLSDKDRNDAETYHYSTMGDFLLRSQLDAHDPRLPGTGMFDLKTRAVVSIRMDSRDYENGVGYEITDRHGEYQSYEKEYYDMIRSAFLKYSLQVRMGRMDGIFVAFHNTERIFGFQYISLAEMDFALHGTRDTTIGDEEFKLSLDLLNKVLDKATKKWPEKSLRLHFETRGDEAPFMYVFAEPMEEEEIDKIQATNHAVNQDFERKVLGLTEKVGDKSLEAKKMAEWELLRSKVEETVQQDEMDMQKMRAIAENLLEESDHWDDLSPQEKEKCIESLVKSATFDEALPEGEDGSENVLVDEADEEDESGNGEESVDVDDTVGEEEEEEVDPNEEEPSKDEENLEAENEMIVEGPDLKGAIEQEAESPDKVDNDPTDGVTLEDNVAPTDTIEETAEHWAEDSDEAVKSETIEEQKEDITGNFAGLDISDKNGSTDSISEKGENEITEDEPSDKILAMTITIRNKINGDYVVRPVNLEKGKDKWTIEYAMAEVTSQERAQLLLDACKRRRAESFSYEKKVQSNWNDSYLETLRDLTKQGRAWRITQDKLDAEKGPVQVVGLPPHDYKKE